MELFYVLFNLCLKLCDFGLNISIKVFIINSVRIAAVQQILPHLTSDGDANTARPDLDQPVISSLPNLFCLRNPLDITLDTRNKSVLKVEIHIHRKNSTLRYTYISAYLMSRMVARWSRWRSCFVSCPQTLLTSP